MSSKVGASCGIYFMLTCLQPQSLAMDRCTFNSSGWHNRCHLCRRHGARTRWLRTSRSFPILIILMHNAQSCSAAYSAPQTVGVLFAFLNAAVLAPFAEVGALPDFVCNASSVVIHILQVQSNKIYIAGGEYFGDASTENSLLLSRVGTSTFFQGNVKLTSGAKYHYTVANGVGQCNHQLAHIKYDAGTDAGCLRPSTSSGDGTSHQCPLYAVPYHC